MSSYYYFLFLVFTIISAAIVIDANVGEFINLWIKVLNVKAQRIYWLIRFHPKNPITNIIMRFKYNKIARDLEKEFYENK